MKIINEDSTPIGAIMDIISFTKDSIKNKKPKDSLYLKGSISNYTKDLIMTFPVLCDDSLPIETASLISKANERNIVTMIQLLFASAQFNEKDGREAIAKIHNNINIRSFDDYCDDVLDYVDTKVSESAEIKRQTTKIDKSIKDKMNHDKSYPVSSVSDKSLNDYEFRENKYGDRYVKESVVKINEERHPEAYASNFKDVKYDVDVTKSLIDSDVQKANELAPSILVAQINELDPITERIYGKKAFALGVKSRLIPCPSMDIVDRIVAKDKTKVSFLNFIRATTGEIKFVKDFLLCIKQAKIDAKNSIKRGEAAKMWKTLENRSIKNNFSKITRSGNNASSITTLVINQEIVNYMKKEHDFNLENIKNTRMIMDAYNLLAIVICDESTEVAKFFYAGNSSYEHIAYTYLEKESKDNSYKKVINLISKMNSNGRY